jgi:beta-ureidopropionase
MSSKKMRINYSSRRNFLKQSALATGLAAFGNFGFANSQSLQEKTKKNKLAREVWIAGISQMDLYTQTPQSMLDQIMGIVDNVVVYQPDIICLPETFPVVNINQHLNLSEQLEISEKALQQFSGYAKQYNCYIICPVITSEGGNAYNAAVVIDSGGSRLGEYRKIHLTIGEIESGLTPGPLQPPVFQADFGKFGIQICYDIYWNDGWVKLRDQDAEIVFWPSAFAAGQRVNAKACENHYIVVSSTRKNTSKICDLRGEVIAQTGIWDKNFFCGSVNLEKVLVDTWPHVRHFNEIRKKYGRNVRLTTFHEEQWTVIESLSSDIFVADILKEFDIKTFVQDVQEAEVAQIKARKS